MTFVQIFWSNRGCDDDILLPKIGLFNKIMYICPEICLIGGSSGVKNI
jgi:hypothetical protein